MVNGPISTYNTCAPIILNLVKQYVLKLHSPKNRHFCVFRYTSNETISYVSVLLLFIYKSRKLNKIH